MLPESQPSTWQTWMDALKSDNGQKALLQFAASNLRTRRPGENTISVFGDSLGKSMQYYEGLKAKDAAAARAEASFGLEKTKSDNNTRSTNESISNSKSQRKERDNLVASKKKNLTARTNKVNSETATLDNNRIIANDQNTRDAETLPFKTDLMKAQAENLRARTQSAAKSGGMPTAQVQTVSFRANNILALADQKGQKITEAEALNQAFQELAVRNPELWDKNMFIKAFNLKAGESGAIFGQGTELQKSIINTGNAVANQSFPQPLPTKYDAQGARVLDKANLQPGITYQTSQGPRVFTAEEISNANTVN